MDLKDVLSLVQVILVPGVGYLLTLILKLVVEVKKLQAQLESYNDTFAAEFKKSKKMSDDIYLSLDTLKVISVEHSERIKKLEDAVRAMR